MTLFSLIKLTCTVFVQKNCRKFKIIPPKKFLLLENSTLLLFKICEQRLRGLHVFGSLSKRRGQATLGKHTTFLHPKKQANWNYQIILTYTKYWRPSCSRLWYKRRVSLLCVLVCESSDCMTLKMLSHMIALDIWTCIHLEKKYLKIICGFRFQWEPTQIH